MTRINCVPVQELTDKHLLAEYRELPRVSNLIWKWYQKTYNNFSGIGTFVRPSSPQNYVLGIGHVRFFYDKGGYLRKRFEEEIVPEMNRRGFKTTYTSYRIHPDGLNNDWVPDYEALKINRERINERLNK